MEILHYLQKKFAKLSWKGFLVFDGSHRRDEESGLSYRSPLVIAYAPKGQSADAYIIEQLEGEKNPKSCVVVTNDRGLTRHARALGAQVQTNAVFFAALVKKSRGEKKGKRQIEESPQNIERFLKIFEERLQKGSEED